MRPQDPRCLAAASAALLRSDAADVKKSRLGYTIAPVCSSLSTAGWNLLRRTSVQVRCWPFGILFATSLGSLSILLLLSGLWLATHPNDLITRKLIKDLRGETLTCLDLSETEWRNVEACQ